MEVEFIFMDGIGNLYNETILNQIKLAQEVGVQVIVLADADTESKGASCVKDEFGELKYNVPNLKAKLHTYMAAQKLPRRLSNKFGLGDWLFGNQNYWNLDVEALQPLKEFLETNLK